MSEPLVQTLKGFRDFLPVEKRQRDYVAQKITESFELFGFAPLETPTLEYASLLLGKYGQEADQLVYAFEDRGGREIALRYDQTVPSARLLTQYQSQLPRYFRRYQMQNVFRAEKPQAGRYREFTQCDIDIFGSTSPLADAEIMACAYTAIRNIGFKSIKLRVNDRQVLFDALEPFTTDELDVFALIQTIDKLDKKSRDEVINELVSKGLSNSVAIEALETITQAKPSENLQAVLRLCEQLGVPTETLEFTPTLARGLDYYTGVIFEVILPDYLAGSCGGGGRYDRLIKQLGGVEMPAVGMAFGFDRLVEAAIELDLVPTQGTGAEILVTILDEKWLKQSMAVVKKLRQAGFKTELFPSTTDDLGKQLKKANRAKIPYVVMLGENEIKANKVTFKEMSSGEQTLLTLEELLAKLNAN